MDVSLLVNAATVTVAVGALALAVRQLRLMSRQNILPVVLDAFREARSPEWWQARDYVFERLAADCSPDAGVSGLPEPARGMVRTIGFIYDNLGVLVVHDVVDADLVIGFFGPGMKACWDVLEPYIMREREIRRLGYMIFFEELVHRYQEADLARIHRRLGLRPFGA